jgi:site-specific DNA-methyltransferase (cytosine-N4-specific)
MQLCWHPYRYYPYERDLAFREIRMLLAPERVTETKQGVRLEGIPDTKAIERLVYFNYAFDGDQYVPTLQGRLERFNGNERNRQSTRYSTHGLHEYKGKFNPQIARAILNILSVPIGARVLDPFCGSGTSLVECSHIGMTAVGADINPLAVFIANAKLSALQLPPSQLRHEIEATVKRTKSAKLASLSTGNERTKYLECWFDLETLQQIERIRFAIEAGDSECAPVLLCIASNLLRDYSLQDPHDLRIRRRKCPLPETPFIEAFEQAASIFVSRLEGAQMALTKHPARCKALLLDSRSMTLGSAGLGTAKFDCALTSPPYATALPYIDTQRLSLVWMGLLPPSQILRMDARLIGSREIRGESKKDLLSALVDNRGNLPKKQVDYCRTLQAALTDKDGFRRQAMPLLLYRYFVGMAEAFKSVRVCMKDGAAFALIVGNNHTVLGGERFNINTPQHLAQIAQSCGWIHEETVPLQTYQRYGYHVSNAVNSESLVIVRAA